MKGLLEFFFFFNPSSYLKRCGSNKSYDLQHKKATNPPPPSSPPSAPYPHFSGKHGLVLGTLAIFRAEPVRGTRVCPDSSSLRHTFMTETPGARAWLGVHADSWTWGQERSEVLGASPFTHHVNWGYFGFWPGVEVSPCTSFYKLCDHQPLSPLLGSVSGESQTIPGWSNHAVPGHWHEQAPREHMVGPCVLLSLPETNTRPGCYLAVSLDAVVGQVGLEEHTLSPTPYLFLRTSRLILKKYMMLCIPLELRPRAMGG